VFFEGRQCGYCADELTDRVFDIVANKLQAEEGLVAPNPDAYLYGVARNVLREQWKKPAPEALPSDDRPQTKSGPDSTSRREQRRIRDIWDHDRREQQARTDEQSRLDCLDQCLAELPPETRTLILAYYREEKRARILNRQRLAASLDVTLNSLAIRVHRIRTELESCVSNCLGHDILREFRP
jgi:DNA-directed RNA polymerase specialized sigma24 family protein